MFRRFLDEYKEPEKEGSNPPETPQIRLQQQQISSPKWSFPASTPSWLNNFFLITTQLNNIVEKLFKLKIKATK